MSDFKRRHFPSDLMLLCVHWYCKFVISYRMRTLVPQLSAITLSGMPSQ